MQLGNNIQTLRKKKGLSQEKLAEKINVLFPHDEYPSMAIVIVFILLLVFI